MQASFSGRAASSSSRHSSKQHCVVCHASGQFNRPGQLSKPLGRPQLPPSPQQQQHQQQQQTSQDQLLQPIPGTSSSSSTSSSSGWTQQPPLRPGQLLSPPSRLSSHEQHRAARRLDDNDTRLAAYDQLNVQVTVGGQAQPPMLEAPSFNRAPCRVQPFMVPAMRAAHLQRPTPLQGAVMSAVSSGRDVLVAAPSGCGSSTAVLLGLINKVLGIPRSMPRKKAWPLGIILCPTRELAHQLAGQASHLVAGSQLTVKCVTGGASLTQQVLDLRRGADIIIATPGRLMDLLGDAPAYVYLQRLKFLVLEEADELLGPVLLPVVKHLLHHKTMPPHSQRQVIAIGSSALPLQQLQAAVADVLQPGTVVVRATWPLPQLPQQQPAQLQQQNHQEQQQQQSYQEQQLTGSSSVAALLANPAGAVAAAAAATAGAIAPNVTQRFVGVAPQLKHRTLLRLLSGAAAAGVGGAQGPALVFTTSAAEADAVVEQLAASDIPAGALHYARSQNQREEALQCFRFGVTQVLVACGVAYRGLDLPDVALVVNYEVPLSLAEYARRVGVVGRQGRGGAAVTLVTPGDGPAMSHYVALLTASGQTVPDWLAALAVGSSDGSSSGSSDGSSDSNGSSSSAVDISAGHSEAAGAAGIVAESAVIQPATAAGSNTAVSQGFAAGSSKRLQQRTNSFKVLQEGIKFGGYNNSSSSSGRKRLSSSNQG